MKINFKNVSPFFLCLSAFVSLSNSFLYLPVSFAGDKAIFNTRTIVGIKQFRIGVRDFEGKVQSEKYKILGHAIPEIIGLGIIEIENFKFLTRNVFLEKAQEIFSADELILDPGLIFSKKVLKELKINGMIEGSFYEFDEYITVGGVLKTPNGKPISFFKDVSLKKRELFIGLRKFVNVIQRDMQFDSVIEGKPQLAILCFRDSRGGKRSGKFGKELSETINSLIALNNKYRKVPWKNIEGNCELFSDPSETAARIHEADLVIGGEIKGNGKEFEFIPSIFNYWNAKVINLLPVKGKGNALFDFEEEILIMLEDLLSGIIDEEGKINTTPIELVSEDVEDYVQEADKAKNNRNIYLALYLYFKAFVIDPKNLKVLNGLGELKLEANEFHEAEKMFTTALSINPMLLDSYLGLAKVKSRMGNYQSGIKILWKAKEKLGDSWTLKKELALLYYLSDQIDLGIEELKGISNVSDKVKGEQYFLLGKFYRSKIIPKESNSYTTAMNFFKKALEEDYRNHDVKMILGNLYDQRANSFGFGNSQERVLDQELAYEISPNAERVAKLIESYSQNGNLEKLDYLIANSKYKGVYESNILLKIGEALHKNDYLNDGIRYLNIYLSESPNEKEDNRANAHYLMGKSFIKLGAFGAAFKAYEKSLRIRPDNRNARFGKAYSLWQVNKEKEALLEIEKILKKWPNNNTAIFAKNQILAFKKGPEISILNGETLIKESPDNFTGYRTKAFGLFLKGENSKSIEVIQTSLRQVKINELVYFYLIKYLIENGEYQKGLKKVQEILERIQFLSKNIKSKVISYKGLALVRMEKEMDGLKSLKLGVDLDPFRSINHYNLGRGYISMGRIDSGLESLKKAIRRNKKYLVLMEKDSILKKKLDSNSFAKLRAFRQEILENELNNMNMK